MATKTRRSFTDEFKREAVSLLEASGRPLTQMAVELGIQPSMLRNWRDGRGGTAHRSQRLARGGLRTRRRPGKPRSAAEGVGSRRNWLGRRGSATFKKPSASSGGRRDEVPVCRGPSQGAPGAGDVRGAGGQCQRLLRMAGSAGERACSCQPHPCRRHTPRSCRQPRALTAIRVCMPFCPPRADGGATGLPA